MIDELGEDIIRISGYGFSESLKDTLASQPFIRSLKYNNNVIQIGLESSSKHHAKIVGITTESNFHIEDISVTKPDLGSVFKTYRRTYKMKVNGFRAIIIICHKHMREFLQNGEELFGTMIQPILWVGIFGLGMNGLLGSSDTLAVQNCIGFMLPGIIAHSLIGGAIGGGMI